MPSIFSNKSKNCPELERTMKLDESIRTEACSIESSSELRIALAEDTTPVIIKTSPRKDSSKVRFGSLEIYDHAIELGGAGVPKCGAPLTLAWESQAKYVVDVEKYESFRQGAQRSGTELLRPSKDRASLLLDLGYTMRQIQEESSACEKLRKQRQSSSKQLKLPFSKFFR